MKTQIIKANNNTLTSDDLIHVSKLINDDQPVAFPTDTVYGLGCNALSKTAVSKIYAIKGRPTDNPLIVHISSISELYELAHTSDLAMQLANNFWPGQLTMILHKKDMFPKEVTAGLDTVAIRLPSSLIARAIIRNGRKPIAAPSANVSGRPSPTQAKHVITDLYGKIPIIIDGGPCKFGLESTVIDLTSNTPTILRPGPVTINEIEQCIGNIEYESVDMLKELPKAPGMKYKHYSPTAVLTVFNGDIQTIVRNINAITATNSYKKIGIMATIQTHKLYHISDNVVVFTVGDRDEPNTIAANLFATLRDFDEFNVDEIYSESFYDSSLGHSIMNRLNKAATNRIEL
jgi:L-threonylcarbamoyladenylate synthase